MLKNFVIILLILVFGCQNKITKETVINNYNKKINSIDKIEYHIKRIDTFSPDYVWNKTGNVLIEKRKNDTLHKMSFFARSYSLDKNYLYDDYNSFKLSNKSNTYEMVGSYGFRGSPGGQLISDVLFGLDSIYKTVDLIKTKNNYQLYYTFENDTVHDIINVEKTIIVDKTTFLPIRIVKTSERGGERTVGIFEFDSILINNQVKNSIVNQKNKLQDLELIKSAEPVITSLKGTKFNTESLPNLWDDKPINVSEKFPALISFWQFWCSPCIKSLPKLKLLQNMYKDKISVIGISTQNPEKVKHILLSKNIEFLNLKGTNKILEDYHINSFPAYFLVDKDGTIIKEYSVFSEEIEEDIKAL